MTLFDEYCYNLMEFAVSEGAKGKGLTKEECVAYMNMMFGARGVEDYIKEIESKKSAAQVAMNMLREDGSKKDGETMGD